MNILLTGGAGFIGHHFIEHIIKLTDHTITVLDKLSYASSGFDRLKDIGAYTHPRIRVFTHDFTQPIVDGLAKEIGEPDFIVHMGAETHVDRSIKNPWPFVQSNVIGTVRMLDYALTVKSLKKFLYFSTDEVFGPASAGKEFKEWDAYNCTNNYAASKAAAEEFCLSYANCYGLPLVITHMMNVYGERQHPEKYIPIVINKILDGEELQIHATGDKPASRSWVHARNAASAVLFLLENDVLFRDKFNIPGEEYDNLELAKMIASILDKPLKYKIVNFYADRPGHDPRYKLCGKKMRSLGWTPPVEFYPSFKKTILWMTEPERKRWLKW